MSNAFYTVPTAVNEPIKSYAPGSPERTALLSGLRDHSASKMNRLEPNAVDSK